MKFRSSSSFGILLAVCLLGSPAAAQGRDYQLASASRGDWARYSVAAEFPDMSELNGSKREVVRFVADTGPDMVELRSQGDIAGATMRSGDILNRKKPFEPVMGIGNAKVTVRNQGTERIAAGGKTWNCAKTVRAIERPLALERGILGLRGTSTIWTCAEAPLGLVKMINDFETAFSEDYVQRSIETWTFLEGGLKGWAEDVETGPEGETQLFAYEGAGNSLVSDILGQTADYGDAAVAKEEAERPFREAIRNDDVAALKRLEAEGVDLRAYEFQAQFSAEGNMFMDAMDIASFISQETTLLMEAAFEGSLKVARYLVETKKMPVDQRARTPAVNGSRLSDEDPTIGRTALFYAVTDDVSKCGPERMAKKLETARYLISRGANVNLAFRNELAAQTWGSLLTYSLGCQTQGYRWNGTIAALLKAGADPNGTSWSTLGGIDDDPAVTSTALMHAVEAGVLSDVRLLVEAGAKVNAETDFGESAYDRAKKNAAYSKECAEIFSYLKAKGAKPGAFTRMLKGEN